MSAPSTIPVTVTDDAANHIAALGFRPEFDRMVERALTIPGLKHLDVSYVEPYEYGDIPNIQLTAVCDETKSDPIGPDEREFGDWVVDHFPPRVREHFTLFTHHEAP